MQKWGCEIIARFLILDKPVEISPAQPVCDRGYCSSFSIGCEDRGCPLSSEMILLFLESHHNQYGLSS